MKYIALVISFIVASCVHSGAQTYSGSASGNFIVYSMQSLTITNTAGVISFSTPNDYFNGVIANKNAKIEVKSNKNWILSFAAQSTYFTALSKGASTDMPAGVMGIRVNGHSSFKTLSTQSQTLKDGSKGNGHDFDIDINFNPGFRYSGGLYNIGIVYTLSKQ